MKKLVSILLFLFVWIGLSAQNTPAFWNDTEQFKKIDKEQTPESDSVLLIGSSSFTMWKDLYDYFPGIEFILNTSTLQKQCPARTNNSTWKTSFI